MILFVSIVYAYTHLQGAFDLPKPHITRVFQLIVPNNDQQNKKTKKTKKKLKYELIDLEKNILKFIYENKIGLLHF